MSFKSLVQISAAITMATVLSACARNNPFEVTVSHCPAVSVMGDMGTYTRIKGDTGLADDIEYTATVLNVRSSCDQGDNVVTDVAFDVSALAGPAMKDSSVTVEYFILTLKDNNLLVSKETYKTTLHFDANGRAVSPQTITHTIPTVDQARRYDYELMIALKMTPTEVMLNIE